MRPLGYSTGALAYGDFGRAIDLLAGKHTNAIELSALRYRELPALLTYIRSMNVASFAYVAMHAPTDAPDESALVRDLIEIAARGIHIVVHPDTIHDVRAWAELNGALCIENMDSRKSTGRTVEELRPFFDQLPEARLCFDIGHARQVDPTMTEAMRILAAFGDRLAHLHVSEVDGLGVHHRMSYASLLAFREVADSIRPGAPAIIESPVPPDAISREMALASSVLDHEPELADQPVEPSLS